MPVRDSTEWRHAIIEKKVINFDHGGDRHVVCAWDTCERDGVETHKVVEQTAKLRGERSVTFVFCTERHKMYWLNSTRDLNNLPPGFKRSIM